MGFIVGVAIAVSISDDRAVTICTKGDKMGYTREAVELACRYIIARLYRLISGDP